MDTPRIDARIYGPQEPTGPSFGSGSAEGESGYQRVPQAQAVQGTLSNLEGEAQLAYNNRERASYSDSFKAGISEWTTTNLIRRWNEPKFTDNPLHDPTLSIGNTGLPLTKEQTNTLLETRSPEEYNYRLESIERVHKANQIMADNPTMAAVASFGDPVWFGLDMVSMGAARAARFAGASAKLSRVAAGATGFASAAVVGELARSQTLNDSQEVWVAATLMGSMGALIHDGKKLVPKDEKFPADKLRALSADLAGEKPTLKPPVPAVHAEVPMPREVQMAMQATGKLHIVDDLAGVAAVSQDVATGALKIEEGAKALYLPNEDRVVLIKSNLTKGDDIKGILLHEVGVHMNGARVLGAEAFEGMLTRLESLAQSGNARAKQAFADVPAGTATALRREEALGYYVERNHGAVADTFVGQLLAGVRTKLRDLGLTSLQLSEGEIMQLVRKAAKGRAEPVVQAPVSVGARYSMGVQTPADVSKTVAQKTAKFLEVSLHKSLGAFSAEAAAVADKLVVDPLNHSKASVAATHRAVRQDMAKLQYAFEDHLSTFMANNGGSIWARIFTPHKAAAVQRGVEREVYTEILRRGALEAEGLPIDVSGVKPHINDMVNAYRKATDYALAQRKAAGVVGAEEVKAGWYATRRMDIQKIEAMQAKIIAAGGPKTAIRDMLSIAMQRANGWDAELAHDIAGAMLDRAKRKGYFEDTALRSGGAKETLAEVRDLLERAGLDESRKQRIMDTLVGTVDEAGKPSSLKHRIDMAMDESITIGNAEYSVVDLLDTSTANLLERHLNGASADVAFSTHGLGSTSAITSMRSKLLESISDITKRERAAYLFDNSIAALRGEAVGEQMHDMMRAAAAVTQMTSLGASALWQVTEYATMMSQYGAMRTFGAVIKELPVLKGILGSVEESTHLRNMLSENMAQDTRLRPFISRMEDGYEIHPGNTVQMALQQAKQLVPYMNGMKLVQAHQARVAGNLIVDTMARAAKGEAKAIEAMGKYGMDEATLRTVSADISKHGLDTAKWTQGTWDSVRPTFAKMADDSVLHANIGEVPAFAQFTSVGKFLFTFRGFVNASHNKVLAGTLNNKGFAGLSLMMLYQYPLTMAMTQANNTIAGKPPMTDEKLAKTAFTQMGSLGWLSEFAGAVTGTKQQFGSPGTIAIDKVYKMAGAVGSGDINKAGAAALASVPLLSTILPMKAVGEALKD